MTVMHKEFLAPASFVSITVLSGAVLLSSAVKADSVITPVNIDVPVSCTLGGSGMTSHNDEILNGHYADNIGTTTLKATCNDNAGFAIYAIGYTDDTYGKTVLTDSSLGSTYDIVTGTATTTGNPDVSNWAMKLTATTSPTPTYPIIIAGSSADTLKQAGDTDYSDYAIVPEEYEKVAYKTAGTDIGQSAEGATLTTTYAAYISKTQPAGTYTGQVKYTLIHPYTAPAPLAPLDPSKLNITNAIIYAPNTSDIIGSMSSLPQTTTTLTNASPQAGAISATANSTTELIAPNYKRDGYGFAGWSTEFDAKAAYDSGENVTIYGPNETISTNPANGGLNVTGGAVLYPVWIESSGNLQSWDGCTDLEPVSYDTETGELTATLDSITALTDTRDNNVYTVARLADGLCWMVENLRLDADYSTNSSLAQGYDTGFIGLPASEDANFDTNGAANNLYSTGNYRTMPRYNNNNTNMTTNATNSAGTTLEDKYNVYSDAAKDNHLRWYGYGNYYSWPAAKATITNYTSYSASDAVSTSICPAGWILPLGYQSTGALDDNEQSSTWRVGSFSYLDRKMGGTGQSSSTNSVTNTTMSTYWRKFPNNFVYSGYWNGAQTDYRSSYGRYWSSSASLSYNAYLLSLDGSYVAPGTYGYSKYSGGSLRCVAGS